MYDASWQKQCTDFDIVEEGDVPLLMSLPQMRNLGFQFELTPDKAFLTCPRIGMRKMCLKTAVSTHLILDLQDLAWHMSHVNFHHHKVNSFFSQHDDYEYSQIAVQQDVEEHALVSQDYWQIDPLRRELVRYHKETRKGYHDMSQAKVPIPKEKLQDQRETHVEYKNGKMELLKDNWRTAKKNTILDGFWKGKTVYKIKPGYKIPEESVKTDADKIFGRRGNTEDVFMPEGSSSAPSSLKKEVQKSSAPSSSSSLKREVGPVQEGAFPRLRGKQKVGSPPASAEGSSSKKPIVDDDNEFSREMKKFDEEYKDEEPVAEERSSVPSRVSGQSDSEGKKRTK